MSVVIEPEKLVDNTIAPSKTYINSGKILFPIIITFAFIGVFDNLIHSYRSRKDEYVIYNLAGMRKGIIRRVKLFEMIIVLTFAAFISIFSSALLTFILDQGLRQSSFMLIRGLLS